MTTEPFPSLDEGHDHLRPLSNGKRPVLQQRRRKSSGLGGEIRAGDTGVPAIATMALRGQSPEILRAKSERERRAKPFSRRRKARSLLRRWRNYALRHTWVAPLAMLAVFAALYAVNPRETNVLNHFFFLSYKLEVPEGSPEGTRPLYAKGYWDLAFVSFYIVVLSFTREFIMQTMLRPLALRCGLRSRAKQSRFMEQMYTAVYFGISGPVGLWVMSHTPVWYFRIAGMYEGFPHRELEADLKFYYLFQAAYWAQQAIVLMLGMEKPRKDFKELVGHHVVTLMLIGLSYRFHFTHMGLPVYLTHDISDFFLATSKVLNYIDHPLVGPYFGIFIAVWVYMRHYLNIRILISEFYEFKTIGPYGVVWETEQYKGPLSHYISTALLGSLQALNLFWLFAIGRIAYRFLFHNALADDRSDVEDDEEIEAERMEEKEAMERESQELRRLREAAPKMPEIKVNGAATPEIKVNGAATPEIKVNGAKVEARASGVQGKTRAARRKA